MALSFEPGSMVKFTMLMNVLTHTSQNGLSGMDQDIKFVMGEGIIINTLDLTINGIDGSLPCYVVDTNFGEVIVPEINITAHQPVTEFH
jgi:hypothetical protein